MICRNWAFDAKWLAQYKSDVLTIAVGNLSMGGTGKTPFVEFLLSQLRNDHRMATLSRGYGRKTKGFLQAHQASQADEIGDEPLQLFKKFGNNVVISVCEKRVDGLKELEQLTVPPELVVMDDAFQHRYASRDFNVLLTTYSVPFYNDYVLPTGNLREGRIGAKRADAIVVTKCPLHLNDNAKQKIKGRLRPYVSPDKIYFSSIRYAQFKNFQHQDEAITLNDIAVLTGIANGEDVLNELEKFNIVEHFKFADHHNFTEQDLDRIAEILAQRELPIITTEKDMVRLLGMGSHPLFDHHKFYYLPIAFDLDREKDFFEQLLSALKA